MPSARRSRHVRQLDGLPSPSSYRAVGPLLPISQLAPVSKQPLEIVNRGARDAPVRHRTLRATIE